MKLQREDIHPLQDTCPYFASNHFAKTLATKERKERKEKIILPLIIL